MVRKANLVTCFVSSLDFRSAADTGFITSNVVSKDMLVLGLWSRNSFGLQDVVGDTKVREACASQNRPNSLKRPGANNCRLTIKLSSGSAPV